MMTDSVETNFEQNTAVACEFNANDAIEIIANDVDTSVSVEDSEASEPIAELPNGFIALGLADELIQATKEMGFTQPTIVQQKPFLWHCQRTALTAHPRNSST